MADHHEDALPVREAVLCTERRLGAHEGNILVAQANLATSLRMLKRLDEAMRMRRETYSGTLKLYGEEHRETLIEINNYANSLLSLGRWEEARALLGKWPVAQRVLGKSNQLTLTIGAGYAVALYQNPGATLDDLHEAVHTLEELEPIARRVFGGAHSLVVDIGRCLRDARAVADRRSASPPSPTAWVVGGGALTYATTAADPREGVVAGECLN